MFHFVGSGLKPRFRGGLGATFVGALCGLSVVSIIDGKFDLWPADSVLLNDVVLVIIGAVSMGALAFSARSAPPALLSTSCVNVGMPAMEQMWVCAPTTFHEYNSAWNAARRWTRPYASHIRKILNRRQTATCLTHEKTAATSLLRRRCRKRSWTEDSLSSALCHRLLFARAVLRPARAWTAAERLAPPM